MERVRKGGKRPQEDDTNLQTFQTRGGDGVIGNPEQAGTTWGLSRRELVGGCSCLRLCCPGQKERKGETPSVSLSMLLGSCTHVMHIPQQSEELIKRQTGAEFPTGSTEQQVVDETGMGLASAPSQLECLKSFVKAMAFGGLFI